MPITPDSVADNRPTCFIAMPVSTSEEHAKTYGDPHHWPHVMEHLFVPAIQAAGYRPVRPVTKGAFMIHDQIVKNLGECDLVLVDLSQTNPNVFWEFGVRTSLNKPVCLVRDETVTRLPFDTSGMNTETYASSLAHWDMAEQVEKLTSHITESAVSCGGENPLWRQYGLAITAQQPSSDESPGDAKLDLVLQQISQLALPQAQPPQERVTDSMTRAWEEPKDVHPELLKAIDHLLCPIELRRRFRASGGRELFITPSPAARPTQEQVQALRNLALTMEWYLVINGWGDAETPPPIVVY